MDHRLFDEKAVARILRRTAELQGARDQQPSTGLSLEELKTLAAESGLDPDLITAAVGELEADRVADTGGWWGGPTSIVIEQELPVEIDDHTWERMLDAIRGTMNDPGTVDVRGATREYTQKANDGNQSQVSARTRNGRTHMRLYRNVPVLPTVLFVFYAIGVFISGIVVFVKSAAAISFALPIWLAVVSTVFFLLRWVISRSTSSERRKIARLMSELNTIAMRSAPAPVTESSRTPESGFERVELPDDMETGETEPHSERSRSRSRD